jgi:hypothetical protein
MPFDHFVQPRSAPLGVALPALCAYFHTDAVERGTGLGIRGCAEIRVKMIRMPVGET